MSKIYIVLILLALFAYGWWYVTPHYVSTESSQKLINTVSYFCNENKTIKAEFFAGEKKEVVSGEMPIPTDTVNVYLSDGTNLVLNQTISANGARYTNQDESFVFWSKGNTVLILENNEEKNYTGCIVVESQPEGSSLSEVYVNSLEGFSIRIPQGYEIDEAYQRELTSEKIIEGIRFYIPESKAEGTNLSNDSYISIEKISNTESCSADLFFDTTIGGAQNINENTETFSVAGNDDAAAGNRYEEIVYAIPGSIPCIGIRYFIHYGVFENYEEGSVSEFNKDDLIKEFDSIRRTFIQA
jgi:membrane-bound inhibitor of C-type lysozyme